MKSSCKHCIKKIEITDLKAFLAGEKNSVQIILAFTVYIKDMINII